MDELKKGFMIQWMDLNSSIGKGMVELKKGFMIQWMDLNNSIGRGMVEEHDELVSESVFVHPHSILTPFQILFLI